LKIEKRIRIVSAAGHGFTAGAAEAIGEELSTCGAAVHVRSAKDRSEVGSYDAVIVGSAIQYRRWLPEVMSSHKRTGTNVRRASNWLEA
jgi:menaquinone-dependent protoporphyrinogen IX oxidase